ncbi:dual 3,5-cyclic-AMP and -GMP phosphodiesterase 11A, partial [Biomphalaria glabrata]
ALLEVVHDLFTEQTSVDHVVLKIMQRAQSLLKCERCSLLLKDKESNSEVSSKIQLMSYPSLCRHLYLDMYGSLTDNMLY